MKIEKIWVSEMGHFCQRSSHRLPKGCQRRKEERRRRGVKVGCVKVGEVKAILHDLGLSSRFPIKKSE